MLELQRRYIACFDGTGEFAHPYDILLDDYEPGLTTEELQGIFARLQAELVPLVSAAAAAGEDGHVFPGHFPVEAPAARWPTSCCTPSASTTEHWRLDPSVHPFARSMAATDVRLTTRWEEDDLAMAFYSCLHEFGHGLYEAQFEPRHYRTTLGRGRGARRRTSRRRGCGRTSSAARGRSASGSCRCCAAISAGRSRRRTPPRSTAPSTRSGSR